jgi:hypothetical protein
MVNVHRMLISATVALGAVLASPGPAMAQWHNGDDPLYHYFYYEGDRSQHGGWQDVGEAQDTCNSWGVGRQQLWGVSSASFYAEVWAYCRDGQLSLN